MNRFLRRILWAYGVSLLAALCYVPWYGQPVEPWGARPVLRYAPVWMPPQTVGYQFLLDAGRLFLTIISLSLVLATAVISLWGDPES